MNYTQSAATRHALLERWRIQIGNRLGAGPCLPRSAAVLTTAQRGPNAGGLLDVQDLSIVVLHDQAETYGQIKIRLAAFRARRIPWGIRWGGSHGHVLEKNLRLKPRRGAHGPRLDLQATDWIKRALQLDSRLRRDAEYGLMPTHRRLELPRLWAGFRQRDAGHITGDGPELCGICHTSGQSVRTLMETSRRQHRDLVLFPLDWTSHHWREIVTIFADLTSFPRYQTIHLAEPAEALQGFRGACEFDFLTSGFRRSRVRSKIGHRSRAVRTEVARFAHH